MVNYTRLANDTDAGASRGTVSVATDPETLFEVANHETERLTGEASPEAERLTGDDSRVSDGGARSPGESLLFLSPLQYEMRLHNGIQEPGTIQEPGAIQEGSSGDADEGPVPWSRKLLRTSRRLVNRYFPYSPLSLVAAGDRGGAYMDVVRGAAHDGVFSTAQASALQPKPVAPVHVLPNYTAALSDPAPSYAATFDPYAEDSLFINGLPVGNAVILCWNVVIVFMFQYIGFFLTYLLHTSHASKYGSQIGLGVTLIKWGSQMLSDSNESPELGETGTPSKIQPSDPTNYDQVEVVSGVLDTYRSELPALAATATTTTTKTPFSFTSLHGFIWVVISLGVFVCLRALYGCYQIKRLEYRILNGFSDEALEEGTFGQHPEEEAFDLEELHNHRG